MRTAQEIAKTIEREAKSKNVSINRLLTDCELKGPVIANMRAGSMPSADKLSIIADYLAVSTDYLLGKTNDPTPPGRDPSDIYIIMRNPEGVTPEEREGLVEYLKDSIDVYINARKREAERKK